MYIIKVGGAVLRSKTDFTTMQQVVASIANEKPVIVVISALGKTTRRLEELCKLAEQQGWDIAQSAAQNLYNDHIQLAEELFPTEKLPSVQESFTPSWNTLLSILKGIALTGETTPRARDTVLATGEYWAIALVQAFFAFHNSPALFADSARWLVTNADFGSARPLESPTIARLHERLLPLFQQSNIIITQGFIGHTEDGFVTTMGNETSNVTATLLAALLQEKTVHIVTDVQGVCSTDPAQFAEAVLIPRLSYRQAKAAAESGLKLLYPEMLSLAERYGIEIRISSFATLDNGTSIQQHESAPSPLLIVSPFQTKEHFLQPEHTIASAFQTELAIVACDTSTLFAALEQINGFEVIQKINAGYKPDVHTVSVLKEHISTFLTDLHQALYE